MATGFRIGSRTGMLKSSVNIIGVVNAAQLLRLGHYV
jgi:hypothetical protein